DKIAKDDADQQVDDGQHDQRGDGNLRDGGKKPQHGTDYLERAARRTRGVLQGRSQGFGPPLRQALKPAISSHSAPNWLLYAGQIFSCATLRNSSTLASTTVMPFGSSSFLALSKLSTDSVA